MKILNCIALISGLVLTGIIISCGDGSERHEATLAPVKNFNGFDSREEWGAHIVTIAACHDCHTPKKFGPAGMMLDSTKLLAGHLEGAP